MELADFFDPVSLPDFTFEDGKNYRRMGDTMDIYRDDLPFPALDEIDIAIVGVGEDRNAVSNSGSDTAPDDVRKYFYPLFTGNYNLKMADLGNLRLGHTVEDTYFAVSTVISELIARNIFPVIIGGSQDITYANYTAYETLGQIINIVAIDPRFDLGDVEGQMDNTSYLSKIIMHQPNFLFNFTNLGYQSYYVDYEAVKLLKNLLFDSYRLGIIRESIDETEPLIRNADMISIDMSAIRQSDAPGNELPSPNGFYGEELCQIMKYAGVSDKLSSLGIYEVNPGYDNLGQTAHLAAQMIWYFIEGFYQRKNDFPLKSADYSEQDFVKYMVPIEDHDHEIVFLKSKLSDRWWMQVPCNSSTSVNYERHYMVPCSYNDYQIALKNEVPDRWWQVYQKLM
jgi:formiminoglutamase